MGRPGRMKWISIPCWCAQASKIRLVNSVTVVDHDLLWKTAPLSQTLEHPCDPQPRQRGVDLDRGAFPGEVVDDCQGPEAAAVQQRVGDKVHRPPLICLDGDRQRAPGHARQPSPQTPPNGQTFFPVHTQQPLVIHPQSIPRHQHVQASIPIPRTRGGMLPQALSKREIRRPSRQVTDARPSKAQRSS